MKLSLRPAIILMSVIAIVFLCYSLIAKNKSGPHITESIFPNEDGFMFTAAGDFGDSDEADKVLTGIGEMSNNSFTLALGDLGYSGNGKEGDWCDFVLEKIGNEHPFEIIAGNHDDGNGDGDIRAYAECLPNKIDGVVGDYGIQYYFDYMDIARFIMISPDIDNYGFGYSDNSENLNWVIDRIDDGRSKGIEWIFLAMHKNCITPGEKTCEIGEDLLNTAVEKGVDVVLQGHEHSYFRSKQLALDAENCPAMVINSINQNCISSEGSVFEKSKGTVVVISGAGGKKLRNVNFNDPEFEYFESANGLNSGNSYGFSLFNVSPNSIDARFIPVAGSFTDGFSIVK